MTYLACYKGPSEGFFNKLFHKVTCWWTKSIYSHCEIVVDGLGYSASSRDKGVRIKRIDFNSGKWDLIPIALDKQKLFQFYEATRNDGYDYTGLFSFVFGGYRQEKDKWFCSEWCAKASGVPFAYKLHIQDLVDYFEGKYAVSK